jgi:hypothetical protein
MIENKRHISIMFFIKIQNPSIKKESIPFHRIVIFQQRVLKTCLKEAYFRRIRVCDK